MPEIKKIRKNGTDYTLADETARAAAQDAREMAGYQADLVRMEMAQALAGKADAGVSYTKTESDAAIAQVQESADQAYTAAEHARVDVAVETNARTIADAEINRKVDMLYKVSEGVLWTIERREESGVAALPKGGEYGNVDEVRGKTEQGENPTPDNPQEIVSVDCFTVRHTDADGNMLDERAITPPHPLNAIGEYKDFADVVNGEWVYRNDVVKLKELNWIRSVSGTKIYYGGTGISNPTATYAPVFCDCFGPTTWALAKQGIYVQETGAVVVMTSEYNNVAEFRAAIGEARLAYPITVHTTEPISPDDLEWFRNLALEEGENLFITDNHGRDVSYLMSDFINLKKAVEQ